MNKIMAFSVILALLLLAGCGKSEPAGTVQQDMPPSGTSSASDISSQSPDSSAGETIDYNQYIKKTWIMSNGKSDENAVSFTISSIENGKFTGELTVVGSGQSHPNTVAALNGTINENTAECQFTDSRGNTGNFSLTFNSDDGIEATIKLIEKSTDYLAQPPEGTFQFTPWNIKNIEEFSRLENQSFSVELNSWGTVNFVSGKYTGDHYVPLGFYLTDINGDILYQFDTVLTDCTDVNAVSFKDANSDSLTDIVIIASKGSNSGNVSTVYFQKPDGSLVNDPKLDKGLNGSGKNKDVQSVLDFVSQNDGTVTSADNSAGATIEPTPNFSIDESACKLWQLAYVTLLRQTINNEKPVRIAHSEGNFNDSDPQLSDSYWLYDVDKDGIPEIFIKYGNCEADFYTEVYTYKNESLIHIGDFPSGHTSLYTWPEENAVLLVWGHMGYAEMDKLSIVNGELAFKNIFTEDISQNPGEEYTETEKIVPGAAYLEAYRTTLNLPQYTSLTLPVYNYYPGTSPAADGGRGNKAIQEVLAGNKKLYGVSADGFGGDTGWMFFKDYCQPGAASKYASQPLEILKSGWVDFNQDGREEGILLMGEGAQSSISDDIYVVISEQDGIVYAYCINFGCREEVYQDGVFAVYDSDIDVSFGISFYKNQCYTYSKAYDINVPAITWET